MKLLEKFKRRDKKPDDASHENSDNLEHPEQRGIEGERGMPDLSKSKSAEGRMTSYIIVTMVVVIGLVALYRYYVIQLEKRREQEEAAAPARDARKTANSNVAPFQPGEGAPPPPPNIGEQSIVPPVKTDKRDQAVPVSAKQPQYGPDGKQILTPEERLLQERLSAPVSYKRESGAGTAAAKYALGTAGTAIQQANVGALGSSLISTSTPTARAMLLPDRDYIVPKGTMVDCTLETAIQSSLTGFVKCIQTWDVYSDSGHVLLLERGTIYTGEYRADMTPGQASLFILWAEARTPKGVVVELASPATDSLGRAGAGGFLDKHFWDRFGTALMFTAIQTGSTVLQNRTQKGNNTVFNSGGGNSDMNTLVNDLVKPGMQISNSIIKNHGEHINIFVARLLDFRNVYELRNSR